MIKSGNCYSSKKLNFTLYVLIILWISPDLLHAQINNFSPDYYYQSSLSLQKKGMIVLGSWAMMNMLSGTYGVLSFEGERKYFHQMNAAWNFVNLGIAVAGFYGASSASDMMLTTQGMMDEVNHFDKILLINAGLDVLYIGTGILLWKNGRIKNNDRRIGYGKSVVVQGGFLLLFDTVLYLLNHQHSEALVSLNDTIALTPNGFRINF